MLCAADDCILDHYFCFQSCFCFANFNALNWRALAAISEVCIRWTCAISLSVTLSTVRYCISFGLQVEDSNKKIM